MVTFAGAVKTALLTGFVMLTVGEGEATVMLTTEEVAEMPAAVATAVRA
jgi:hypothetical protein